MTSKTPTALLPDSNPSSDQKLMTQSTSSYVKSMDASSNPAQREPVLPVDSIPSPNRNKTRTSLISRSRASPIHTRPALQEGYEKPITDRERWWRDTIKETPGPAAYDTPATLLPDFKRRPNTYRFKSDGRKIDPQPQIGRGVYLMPGAYEHKDMSNLLERSLTTYNFKSTGREARDAMNFGRKDKDINVSPDTYSMERHLSLTCDRQPSKHWNFRSQSQRFPTIQFVPKIGPSPGEYEYGPPSSASICSSSFKSKTPRFITSHTKTPGPGSYEKVFQSPMPKTVLNMARHHGVFFSSAFQV